MVRGFIAVTVFVPSMAAAQAWLPQSAWDFTAGRGDVATSVSAGLLTRPALGPGWLRLGLGLRATVASGDFQLTAAGAHDVPAGVADTLSITGTAFMLNLSGHVSVAPHDRFEAGLNIDLAGIGAGGDRTGSYRQSPAATPASESASPAGSNLFLYGSKDRGSLNSEFFASWKATDRLTVRGGLSHQLVEYRASRALASNTDRFRQYTNLLFVGVRLAR